MMGVAILLQATTILGSTQVSTRGFIYYTCTIRLQFFGLFSYTCIKVACSDPTTPTMKMGVPMGVAISSSPEKSSKI